MLQNIDQWIKEKPDSPVALTRRIRLESVEGKDAVIFPPTYANIGYNIDTLADGTKVALIDSVGSQANRMEPIFKDTPYTKLVPQIIIQAGNDKEVSIFEVGHRVADALARSSKPEDAEVALGEEAFSALAKGNALPMAKLAPTSLVFGVWDSRGTQVKVPRLINSVIRAYDVSDLKRSAQYFAALRPDEYIQTGALTEKEYNDKGKALSEVGFRDAPAPGTHGGIIANGGVYRHCTVNLVALRQLRAETEEETKKLRRYILGLTLVAATYHQDGFLRQGCLLVEKPEESTPWQAVYRDGRKDNIDLAHEEALVFAKEAAERFGKGPDVRARFNRKLARKVLAAAKKQKD